MQLTSNTATPSSTNHPAWMMKPAKKKNKTERQNKLYNHGIRKNKAKGVSITPLPSACPELTQLPRAQLRQKGPECL